MVRAVAQRDLYFHAGAAGRHAVWQGFLQALVHSRNVFPGNRAALDRIHEFVTLARRVRLNLEPDMAILTAATGLLDELALDFNRFLDGLAVSDLRLADVGFHAEFALHAIYNNLEMQLAHSRDDGLAGFLVGTHAERRVFLSKTVQRNAHLLLVCLGL